MSVYNWPNRTGRSPRRTGGSSISPVFLLIVLIFGVGCYLAYAGIGNLKFDAFLVVAGGWIISLCLHEFAHAATAYQGGDHTVRQQGYLTLNPFRYTHPLMSIVMPLIFVILGGIPLPGGAVYIERYNLRGKWWDTAVSLAGPVTNALCAVVLLIVLKFVNPLGSGVFLWASLSYLAFLQIYATIINLLPIPPLDGYGVIEPHLPSEARRIGRQIGQFGWIIIFILIWEVPGVNRALVDAVSDIGSAFGLNGALTAVGTYLFQSPFDFLHRGGGIL